MHYASMDSTDNKFINCKTLVKAGRAFGGNADGIQARANRIGPWIEGCAIDTIGDDGVSMTNVEYLPSGGGFGNQYVVQFSTGLVASLNTGGDPYSNAQAFGIIERSELFAIGKSTFRIRWLPEEAKAAL